MEFRNEEKVLEEVSSNYNDNQVAYVQEILPLKIERHNRDLNTISFKNDIKNNF